MNDNRIFNALTDIDDDLIKGAERPQTEKTMKKQGAETLRPRRKLWLALAAALLMIAMVFAALAAGGAFTKKPEDAPGVLPATDGRTDEPTSRTADGTTTVTTTPPSASTIWPSHDLVETTVFVSGALSEDELKSDHDRMAFVGLRAYVIDGKTYLCLDEFSALYDPETQTFVGGQRRPSSWFCRVWERMYEGGAHDNQKVYVAYGSTSTLVVSGGKANGVACIDLLTGEAEKLIACEGPVTSVFVQNGVLYFTEAVLSKEGGEDLVHVYAADLKTKKILDVWALGGSGCKSAQIFGVSADALTLCVSIERRMYFCTIPFDGSDAAFTEIEHENEKRMEFFFGNGKLYGYIVEPGTDLYDCPECIFEILKNGERRVVCTFSEEDRANLRLRGTYFDQMPFLDGKLVAVRDHTLILRNLETGEETTLVTGVCTDGANRKGKSFTSVVSDGTLYFHDLCSDTLYVIKDGAVLSKTELPGL